MNMKYKALFLDLDGTTVPSELLGAEHTLPSPRVTQAIAQIKDKLAVCVATGRPLFAAKNVLDHLKLSGLCVLNNGVQIYNPKEKKVIYEKAIDSSLLPAITAIAKKYNIKIHLYDGISDNLYDEKVRVVDKVLSVYISDLTEKVADSVIADLSSIRRLATHKMHHEDLFFVEITHASVSKLHGIVEVAKRLGLKREEIIGVGDSYNDFPLLMACGLRFAMGNAVSELKAIADFVAPSVENDGVAVIIEKFIIPLISDKIST